MSLEENLKTVINVLAKNITEKKQKDNEELFLELKKIYNEDPNEFMTLMSIANFDLEEILESIIEIPEQKYDFVIKYILNGMYEEFHEKRMEKLEGFSCSADKSSFITQLTLKALKTNRNISLYQDYQNIEQIKENKERQAYWSPRTVKDTNEAIELFLDWYNYKQTKEEEYLEALRKIDNHIRCTSEPMDYIIEELKKVLPEYKE